MILGVDGGRWIQDKPGYDLADLHFQAMCYTMQNSCSGCWSGFYGDCPEDGPYVCWTAHCCGKRAWGCKVSAISGALLGSRSVRGQSSKLNLYAGSKAFLSGTKDDTCTNMCCFHIPMSCPNGGLPVVVVRTDNYEPSFPFKINGRRPYSQVHGLPSTVPFPSGPNVKMSSGPKETKIRAPFNFSPTPKCVC